MNAEELRLFEKEIEELYEAAKIRGPIHLRTGNEEQLIDIFKDVDERDVVFSTWANHLHALLAGVPRDLVKKRIMEGESMAMNFPSYGFYTSAIVGGVAPIATGMAMSSKLNGYKFRSWCFIGDMAFHNGVVLDSIQYSIAQDLPITWVVEDNGISVSTPTESTTMSTQKLFEMFKNALNEYSKVNMIYYKYNNTYAHSGTGVFVEF